jgi:hypothetical protein
MNYNSYLHMYKSYIVKLIILIELT